jgi:hypothetical protein
MGPSHATEYRKVAGVPAVGAKKPFVMRRAYKCDTIPQYRLCSDFTVNLSRSKLKHPGFAGRALTN